MALNSIQDVLLMTPFKVTSCPYHQWHFPWNITLTSGILTNQHLDNGAINKQWKPLQMMQNDWAYCPYIWKLVGHTLCISGSKVDLNQVPDFLHGDGFPTRNIKSQTFICTPESQSRLTKEGKIKLTLVGKQDI